MIRAHLKDCGKPHTFLKRLLIMLSCQFTREYNVMQVTVATVCPLFYTVAGLRTEASATWRGAGLQGCASGCPHDRVRSSMKLEQTLLSLALSGRADVTAMPCYTRVVVCDLTGNRDGIPLHCMNGREPLTCMVAGVICNLPSIGRWRRSGRW